MSEPNRTTDHQKIRSWVEERNGRPARVKGTSTEDDPGLLRIHFPGVSDGLLEDISWEDFFEKFEDNQLAFLYRDTEKGKRSNFHRLTRR